MRSRDSAPLPPSDGSAQPVVADAVVTIGQADHASKVGDAARFEIEACAFEAPCQLGATLVKEFTASATAACGTRGVKGNLWQNLVLDAIVHRHGRIYPCHFNRDHVIL